ncbi:MAG: hypothetical protein A4E72_01495 [Syntrophus sp. PtaU1.Bin208]|nr:MAG: hypothetical protein A4E72_01495 [Syntrophus sp. PtaU1.Bin208]
MNRFIYLIGQQVPDTGHIPIRPGALNCKEVVQASILETFFIKGIISLPDGIQPVDGVIAGRRGNIPDRRSIGTGIEGVPAVRAPEGHRGIHGGCRLPPLLDEPVNPVENGPQQKDIHQANASAEATGSMAESQAAEKQRTSHAAQNTTGQASHEAAGL